MERNQIEEISKLMDDELESQGLDRLIENVSSSSNTRDRCARYLLAQAAMRGDLTQSVDPGLANRISMEIDNENTHQSSNLLQFNKRPRVRQVAWVSMAASIVVAVLVMLPMNQQRTTSNHELRVMAETPPAEQIVSVATRTNQQHTGVSPSVADTLGTEQRKFDVYFSNHGEFAMTSSFRGNMAPYMTIVNLNDRSY